MRVTLHLPTYLDLGGSAIRLSPGSNEVDPKAWGEVVKNSHIARHYISTKAITVEKADK